MPRAKRTGYQRSTRRPAWLTMRPSLIRATVRFWKRQAHWQPPREEAR